MRFLLNSLIIIAGNAITAAGAVLFIIPNGFTMGGTTGIGIFVRNLISESVVWREWVVSITVYAVNIALFVVGALILGKKFAASTFAGTLLYPTFVAFFTYINDLYVEANGAPIGVAGEMGNPVVAAICGGVLFGLGISFVIRVGASTGGTDIPALLLQRFFGTPVSTTLTVLDTVIIFLQFTAPEVGLNAVIYGIGINVLHSVVIAKISPIGMRRTQVKIISNHYLEIRDIILNKISRGVTVLYGQTGYLKEDCHMLLTVISPRQLVPLKAEIQKIDPNAFMTISEVSEVRGNGFHTDGVEFLMPEEREYLTIVPPEELEKEKEDAKD